MALSFVAVDVELADNKEKGSICSIGVVTVEGGQITDAFYSLVNPQITFSPMCSKIHGIKAETVADAPTFQQLWPELKKRLEGRILLSYGASADIYPLERAMYNAGISEAPLYYLCAMAIAKKLLNLQKYKLSEVAKRFGIAFNAHNSLEDAKATARIILAIGNQLGIHNVAILGHLANTAIASTASNGYDPANDKAGRSYGPNNDLHFYYNALNV